MSTAVALPIKRPVLRYHGGKFRLAPRLNEAAWKGSRRRLFE